MNNTFHQPSKNQNKANIIKELNIKNTLGYKNYASYTTDCSSYICLCDCQNMSQAHNKLILFLYFLLITANFNILFK